MAKMRGRLGASVFGGDVLDVALASAGFFATVLVGVLFFKAAIAPRTTTTARDAAGTRAGHRPRQLDAATKAHRHPHHRRAPAAELAAFSGEPRSGPRAKPELALSRAAGRRAM